MDLIQNFEVDLLQEKPLIRVIPIISFVMPLPAGT